jgi:hypothetical protein
MKKLSMGLLLLAILQGCAGLKPIPARIYHALFALDQPALATARLTDARGNEITVLWSNKAVPAGAVTVDWDGRDKDGKNAAPGLYRITFSASRFGLKPLVSFGGQGATPGRFLDPEGLCAYPQGARLTVAVADTGNNRVQLLTDQGGFLQSAGDFGTGDEALNQPTDVDWDGQILTVCDSQDRRLVLFDDRGDFLSQVVKLSGLQTSVGALPPVLDFENPQCLRHDAGAFWVSDAGHGILFQVTNTGAVLNEIGAQFPLNNDGPFLPVGEGFWVKTGRNQVQAVDSNGNSQGEIKADPPFKNVTGFAASSQSFNLISDQENGLVYLADNSGGVFEALSPEGAAHPGAMSLWEDQLFVADPDQNEVFHYQVVPQKLPEAQREIQVYGGEETPGP